MKTIFRIAKAELLTLFYSPVAWLVLIIFALQVGMEFSDSFAQCLKNKALGYNLYNVTSRLYTGFSLFGEMQNNLYLYIPLLTMGLVSREIGSGSIKLLFSSPVTTSKIIFGKYLAMCLYCFILIVILFVPVVIGMFTVKDLDLPSILSGLLGLYLLICSYSAIGLFMSCLTSYQVVAAMGTFAVLAVLNFIGGVGQDIAFVRDITYWLSISGRTTELLRGLICSEDVLYFFIVISLFIGFSVIKIQSMVDNRSTKAVVARYSSVFLIVVLLGYITSRPTMMTYVDTTATKLNTLTKNSQEIMEKMDGDITLTTYCNILGENFHTVSPSGINRDIERFEKYIRFKPEMKMEYVYYYDKVDNPILKRYYPDLTEEEIARKMCKVYGYDFDMFLSPKEIRKVIDLKSEGNCFVRQIVRENGQKAFLRLFNDNQRHPSETEITAAFKSLIVKSPKVGFLQGHGERLINRNRDKDYSAFVNNRSFRSSLINQGFEGVNLLLNEEIPSDIDIVVIADIRKAFTNDELSKLDKYIARGGNLIVLGEANRQELINPFINRFGVSMKPGVLVQPQRDLVANVIGGNLTKETKNIGSRLYKLYAYRYQIAMEGAAGLDYSEDKGFKVTPLVVTNSRGSWRELQTTNFAEEEVSLDVKSGEREEVNPIALALSRNVGNKEQKIIVIGDADCISNGELSLNRNKINSANFSFIPGMFQWLSNDEYPINTSRVRPTDNDVKFKRSNLKYLKIFFLGIFPALILLLGGGLLFKRKFR